ncbi:MAG: hypothetical protein JW839_04590 [Candidatus Lokiarchaeota archaeon]|nr:hypothetical protein [Candidatus Lokiarchaeota archaeon]
MSQTDRWLPSDIEQPATSNPASLPSTTATAWNGTASRNSQGILSVLPRVVVPSSNRTRVMLASSGV